jgi:uncharacterized membrane protein
LQDYLELLLVFAIYSFLGWVVETVFARIKEGKLINRGFLKGPFCPIYGFGVIFIVKTSSLLSIYRKDYHTWLFISIVFSIILVTLLEYITGLILESIFKCKWWDYSDNYANIKGYVCLKYSLIWGLFAFLIICEVNPLILMIIDKIPNKVQRYSVVILLFYFVGDTIKSIIDTLKLRDVIMNYSKFSVNKYYENIIEYKRLFIAFPRLMLLNAGVVNRDIRSILNGQIDKIKNVYKNKFSE